MRSTFFSIILPTYNRAGMISKAIESVISQTFTDWELIIVDDGGNDDTKHVVDTFNNDKIRYHWQENSGRSAARNVGLSMVRGKYVCFLDDDDWFLENHLDVLFNNTVSTNNLILKTGALVSRGCQKVKEGLISETNKSVLDYLWDHGISLFQLCIPKQVIGRLIFDRHLPYGQDLMWVMQIVIRGVELVEINQYTVVINDHSSRSHNSGAESEILKKNKSLKLLFHQIYEFNSQKYFDESRLRKKCKLINYRTLKELVKAGHLSGAVKFLVQLKKQFRIL